MPAPSPTGAVEAGFRLAVGRFAGPVRGVGLAVISVFGVLAVPDDAVPLGLGLLGLALVGAVSDGVPATRGTLVALALAVARAGAICATQSWTASGPNLWALNVLTITAITFQWEWPLKIAVPATVGLLAVFLAAGGPPSTLLRVGVECLLARLAFLLLVRSARGVDELRARQAALERAEVLARERRRREREYLALLHDTASATFLLVGSRTADPAEVADFARRDLAVLTGSTGGPGLDDRLVDVESSLRSVVERSPLAIDARWEHVPLLPVPVTLALVRAVREAVTNVERHAGVRAAALGVAGSGDGLVVTVTDTGTGFDPTAVPEHRRGIRGSLVERMAAVGGRATVDSRPGGGTTVRLEWPRG
ncbi:sensor histidine kinase [Umezawaea sp.]|uniref:sensor histidine kinase n=1 Tax=Umezawaea sp. TaxID=1955258 RepID=UPI002ED02BC4